MTTAGFAIVYLMSLAAVADEGVVVRAERTELRWSDGTVVQRVERDNDGQVIRIQFNEMRLSADEFAEIGRLTHLQRLVLYKTNVRDEDLRCLRGLSKLQGLNLTSTEISDGAIDEILQLKELKSLCLGNVDVSPAAVARMKNTFRERGQKVSLGYQRRATSP